mmetsp:Transcript_19435/g.39634  ORF Transcript_19435/g.39634 Transcript_19435/m.39634 type:complete len:91 (-) Transcript_19435:311-583(-)
MAPLTMQKSCASSTTISRANGNSTEEEEEEEELDEEPAPPEVNGVEDGLEADALAPPPFNMARASSKLRLNVALFGSSSVARSYALTAIS